MIIIEVNYVEHIVKFKNSYTLHTYVKFQYSDLYIKILDEMQLIQWTLHMKFSRRKFKTEVILDRLFDWQCHWHKIKSL